MRRGFSLLELMLIIAIIGILTAIAGPRLKKYQLDAKRAEVMSVLKGIADSEITYDLVNNTYVAAASNPGTELSTTAREMDMTMAGWDTLGFKPSGKVRCNYEAVLSEDVEPVVRVDATCDIDRDGNTAVVRNHIPTSTASGFFEDVYPGRY